MDREWVKAIREQSEMAGARGKIIWERVKRVQERTEMGRERVGTVRGRSRTVFPRCGVIVQSPSGSADLQIGEMSSAGSAILQDGSSMITRKEPSWRTALPGSTAFPKEPSWGSVLLGSTEKCRGLNDYAVASFLCRPYPLDGIVVCFPSLRRSRYDQEIRGIPMLATTVTISPNGQIGIPNAMAYTDRYRICGVCLSDHLLPGRVGRS